MERLQVEDVGQPPDRGIDAREQQQTMATVGNMQSDVRNISTVLVLISILYSSSFRGICQNVLVVPKFELPALKSAGDSMSIVEHTGFVLSYNYTTNCPNWVAWDLNEEEAFANIAKRDDYFRGDELIPPYSRVEGYDYKGSGYDRGHMCPAADMKWSTEAMADCFLMTNICPQTPTLNQKWWEHTERACRRWTSQEGTIYICCGPIFTSVKPKFIGDEVQICVPDGYFKVILSMRPGSEKAIGFIFKNNSERQTMEDTATTIDDVEEKTGYDFFPLLPDSIEQKIESIFNLKDWN